MCCAAPGSRFWTRSRTGYRSTITRSCSNCRGSTPTSKISWGPSNRPGMASRYPPFYGSAPAYVSAAEFRADLDGLSASLAANGSLALACGRLRLLRRAVDVFGFHLAPIDLRQNSDVHERVMGELLAAVGTVVDYHALDEDRRIAVLLRVLTSRRPLPSAHLAYLDATVTEHPILLLAAPAP